MLTRLRRFPLAASMTPEARKRAGIRDDPIRVSLDLENLQDLRADLAQALTLS